MTETKQQISDSLENPAFEPEVDDIEDLDPEPTEESNFFLQRARMFMACAGVCLVLMFGMAYYQYATYYPKRFEPVVAGKLYRSGEVSPVQLERLHDEQGIDRVICLLNPEAPVTQAEHKAAESLGLEWINLGMGGSGQHELNQIPELVALLTDPNAPPTLVHCSAGVNRTGLAIGLYRIHHDGWSYEQVYDELLKHDFEDLPKYEQMRATLKAEAQRVAQERQPATAQ